MGRALSLLSAASPHTFVGWLCASLRRSSPAYELTGGKGFAVKTAPTDFAGASVPRSRQEAERRNCVEGHLAWMPNESRWARDGPP